MIIKYKTSFGDRVTRRVGDRIMTEEGKLKNGYTLILGLIFGFILGVSL